MIKLFAQKFLIAIAALVSLAATPSYSQVSTPSLNFNFTNNRPSNEDTAKYLSLSIFSCELGIRRFGDVGRPVDRVALLKLALILAFPLKLEGHTIQLNSYQIYLNQSAEMTMRSASIAAASVGSYISQNYRVGPKCGREQTPFGWFSREDVTNENSPFVVEISATLDGKNISVNSVFSPRIPIPQVATAFSSEAKKNFSNPQVAPEVEAAFAKANAKLIAIISSELEKGPSS